MADGDVQHGTTESAVLDPADFEALLQWAVGQVWRRYGGAIPKAEARQICWLALHRGCRGYDPSCGLAPTTVLSRQMFWDASEHVRGEWRHSRFHTPISVLCRVGNETEADQLSRFAGGGLVPDPTPDTDGRLDLEPIVEQWRARLHPVTLRTIQRRWDIQGGTWAITSTIADIAREDGVTVEAVRNRLRAATNELRLILARMRPGLKLPDHRGHRPPDAATKAMIISRHRQGTKIKSIAEALKVSRTTVRSVIKDAGHATGKTVAERTVFRTLARDHGAEIARRRDAGETFRAIASDLGHAAETVSRAYHRHLATLEAVTA